MRDKSSRTVVEAACSPRTVLCMLVDARVSRLANHGNVSTQLKIDSLRCIANAVSAYTATLEMEWSRIHVYNAQRKGFEGSSWGHLHTHDTMQGPRNKSKVTKFSF